MISTYVINSCADLANVSRELASALAQAMGDPLGPGFQPLAAIMDAHGVEATRDILRRLERVMAAGDQFKPLPCMPIGRMARSFHA